MLSQILLFVVPLVIQSWIYLLLLLCVHLDAAAVARIAAGSAVDAAVVAAAAVLQFLLLCL